MSHIWGTQYIPYRVYFGSCTKQHSHNKNMLLLNYININNYINQGSRFIILYRKYCLAYLSVFDTVLIALIT